jgi:hypothetical protein
MERLCGSYSDIHAQKLTTELTNHEFWYKDDNNITHHDPDK